MRCTSTSARRRAARTAATSATSHSGHPRLRKQVELQQGHDLRLCYQCHGAVDALNREIAPYKGAELCLKCHTELGI